MVNKTISIPDYIFEKLKDVDNASGLITELLENFFKTNLDSLKEIEESLNSIENKRSQIIKNLENENITLLTKKEEIQKQTEFLEKKKEISDKKEFEMIENIKNVFKDFMEREITKEELEDYRFRLKDEKGFNMFRFIEEKGFVFEEEEDEDKNTKTEEM